MAGLELPPIRRSPPFVRFSEEERQRPPSSPPYVPCPLALFLLLPLSCPLSTLYLPNGCITGFETLCLPEQQHGLSWWGIKIGVVLEWQEMLMLPNLSFIPPFQLA